MKAEQRNFNVDDNWSNEETNENTQLVLAFAAISLIKEEKSYNDLKRFYPNADIIMVSTSGEISDIEVNDGSISVNALEFEKTPFKVTSKVVSDGEESYSAGSELATEISAEDLSYVLAFSDGLNVNGTKLLEGIKSELPEGVRVSGGLAGDGANFGNTYVSLNGVPSDENRIVLVGFYGENIEVGSASMAGWDTFGIERIVTKSKGNIVYELDGQPVLELYKKYLGDQSQRLPGSGLMFPICIYDTDKENSIVRTLLSVDENDQSITFAGDVPEGYKAFLMKANFNKLISASGEAAEMSLEKIDKADFALLVSCVGRKLVLKQRVEEEVEEVRDIVGDECVIGGFYSYGEIGVNSIVGGSQLHNQTMTIALFSEK